MNVVSSTALMVKTRWEQFSVAADWFGGITKTPVFSLAAVIMWFLSVQ